MAYIMTSLIGAIIEESEKSRWGGKCKGEGSEDVFVSQTKDKFCSSAGQIKNQTKG